MNIVLRIDNLKNMSQGAAGTVLGVTDLELRSGEIVTLAGPSGCGKTVLLRAIADLDPSSGDAQLDTQKRETYSGPEWRRRVSFVPTESAWWAVTVGAHFAMAPRPQDLGVLGFGAAILAQPVAGLSSGERQRLALLRALSASPRVLLLDEPTASLDADMTHRSETLVRAYVERQRGAALWVTHDLLQIDRIADRALHIDDGRVHPTTGAGTPWTSSR